MTDTKSPATRKVRPAPITALRHELANPLSRNAYALAVNGGMTGILGLGYWFVAARYYAPAQVGQQAAENQAMMLLGGLTALNLLLVRFLPEMGARSGPLASLAYLVSGVAAATMAAGFLLTLDWWGPSFAHLSGLGPGLFFICAAVGWALFTTQDGTLTGLRHSTWVLGKNTAFAGLKIALLLILAIALPAHGITLSWVAAAVGLLIPVEVLIRRRLVPRHVAATTDVRPPPSGGQIRRYLAGDYTGTLCHHATVNLIPVVVATQLDAHLNAFFYLAWVLGATVDVLAVSMAMSLTVEGAFEPGRLAQAGRAVLVRMLLILLPVTVVVLAGAQVGLSVFGAGYAEHGATLLRLLVLAAIPKALIELYIGVLRVRRHTRMIAILQVARLAGVLVLVLPLTAKLGLAGPGYAVLAVSVAGGLAVLPALRQVTRARPARAGVAVPGLTAGAPSRAAVMGGSVRAKLQRWKRRPIAWPAVAAWPLSAAGVCLFWIPLRGVRLERMTGYGLISVLPVATLVGAAVLVLAFMYSLGLRRPYRWLLLFQLVAIVVSLHGLAPAVESFARPPTAWQHAGFIEYITRTGTADYGLDARFSWPGFFAVIAFVTRWAGVHDIEPMLHWAPIAVQLLSLVPLLLILRTLRASWRARWLAAWLFVTVDWVGQDYFSPQAFGYLLYLVFVAVLVNRFRAAPPVVPAAGDGRFGRLLGRLPGGGALRGRLLRGPLVAGERTPPEPHVPEQIVLFCFLVATFAVVTVSHQLTPFLLIFVCTALVLGQRCTLRGMPLLLGVMVVSWISFYTAAYWMRNTGDLFAGFGQLVANIALGVAGRINNTSGELATAQATRAAIAFFLVSLALLGALRRRSRKVDDRVALVLFLAPFVALGMQNYGGEITLRVYLFILPGASVLAAYLFFPERYAAARRLTTMAAATACGLVFVGGFLFVRFSNETFEQVPRDDTAALDATLRAGPAGRVNLVWLTDRYNSPGFPQMPWGFRECERFDYTPLPVTSMTGPTDLSQVIKALRQQPGGYFVTTRVHEAYLSANHRIRAGYTARMRAVLAASDQLRPVRVTDNSAVYALRFPPPGNPPPVRARRSFSFGSTPWTPVGLAVAPALIILLVAGELHRLRRARSEPGAPRRGRSVARGGPRAVRWGLRYGYPVVTVALVLALAVVIAERFAVLGT